MTKSIRVKALMIKGRVTFVLRWRDPVTGKWRDETTEIPCSERNRRKANDAARNKEDELAGVRSEPYSWAEFDERYKDEWLSGKTSGTCITWETATACLGMFRKNTLPLPSEINADLLHSWVAWMRRKNYSEATIKSYLGIIRAGMNWAADVGIIHDVPRFPSIRGAVHMGGRPLCAEEFERMIECIPKVRKRNVEEWRRLLDVLWLSGLRVSEAIALSWDYGSAFAVDLEADSFSILKQKSGKAEYAPMTPDFTAFLRMTPEAERTGRVVKLNVTANQASRVVSLVGKKAGVMTGHNSHATAHDLRRSFGTRWAGKATTAELQRLMRHRDIHTTMSFYVRLDSTSIANKLKLGEIEGEMNRNPNTKTESKKTS